MASSPARAFTLVVLTICCVRLLPSVLGQGAACQQTGPNGFWTTSYCDISGQSFIYYFDDALCSDVQRVVRIHLDLGGSACSSGAPVPPLSWPPPGDEWQRLTRCVGQSRCDTGCVFAGVSRMGLCVRSTPTAGEASPFYNFSARNVLNLKGTASGTLYYRGRNCDENYGFDVSTEHVPAASGCFSMPDGPGVYQTGYYSYASSILRAESNVIVRADEVPLIGSFDGCRRDGWDAAYLYTPGVCGIRGDRYDVNTTHVIRTSYANSATPYSNAYCRDVFYPGETLCPDPTCAPVNLVRTQTYSLADLACPSGRLWVVRNKTATPPAAILPADQWPFIDTAAAPAARVELYVDPARQACSGSRLGSSYASLTVRAWNCTPYAVDAQTTYYIQMSCVSNSFTVYSDSACTVMLAVQKDSGGYANLGYGSTLYNGPNSQTLCVPLAAADSSWGSARVWCDATLYVQPMTARVELYSAVGDSSCSGSVLGTASSELVSPGCSPYVLDDSTTYYLALNCEQHQLGVFKDSGCTQSSTMVSWNSSAVQSGASGQCVRLTRGMDDRGSAKVWCNSSTYVAPPPGSDYVSSAIVVGSHTLLHCLLLSWITTVVW